MKSHLLCWIDIRLICVLIESTWAMLGIQYSLVLKITWLILHTLFAVTVIGQNVDRIGDIFCRSGYIFDRFAQHACQTVNILTASVEILTGSVKISTDSVNILTKHDWFGQFFDQIGKQIDRFDKKITISVILLTETHIKIIPKTFVAVMQFFELRSNSPDIKLRTQEKSHNCIVWGK